MANIMTRSQALDRLRQLREELNNPDADLAAIEAEIAEIEQILETVEEAVEEVADEAEQAAENRDGENDDDEEDHGADGEEEDRTSTARQRAQLRARVAAGQLGAATRNFKNLEGHSMNETVYTNASPEYRSGLLKSLLGQELSTQERSAVSYVATTGDNTYGASKVLPATMLNEIWDLIDEQHAILGDITLYRTGTILEIATRTGITQGDAATVNENAANDDEVNNFAKVTLSGKDFSKHVDISYAMAQMSLEAFENFLVNEIAERIGAALANDVITQINSDYDSTNNAVTTAAASKIAFTDVAGAMAKLKNAKGQCVVYGSHATIFNFLVGMVDTTGRPIFQVNAQEGQEGTLIGCPVKVEDGISGNVLLIGYPKNVVGNMVQDIMIESDRDIKKHVITHSGYARFQCKLVAAKSFAKLTVQNP